MKKLCVVGCGTVGKQLIELYSYRSNEIKPQFDILEFVDPDIITDEKSPYNLYPKIYLMEDLVFHINSNIVCNPIEKRFPDFLSEFTNEEINNTVYIDCRDNENQSDIFYMKILSDGPYGRIIKYPKNNTCCSPTNYKIEKSSYYAKMTVINVIEDILNVRFPLDLKKKDTVHCVYNHTMTIL